MEKKVKLLIVDDEIDFLDTIALRMEMRGFEVTKAPDGFSALESAEKNKYDIVLLDLKMPGINGQEVLEKIKNKNEGIEVIILTAHGSEEVSKETTELGAFCFITKPIDIDRLVTVIRLALESRQKNEIIIL
ncbi:MAG: response regulator [Ignavibacteria bacterium]|nr:response regulator [Ignavibacteria bacterium]